jgi:hypothetical protein
MDKHRTKTQVGLYAQAEHPEASENVRIAMPYVRSSIIDAMSKAKGIGTKQTTDPKTAYRPESGAAFIRLCKE